MGTHPEKGSDKTGHREVVKWGGTDVAAFGAWAETETVGGYTWTYCINGDTAEIMI